MADVALSPIYKPTQLSGKDRIAIQKHKGLDIPLEWRVFAEGVGDASGGDVYCYFNLSNFGNDFYYVITRIYTYTSAALDAYISIVNDEWENFCFPSISNETLILWVGDGAAHGHFNRDSLIRPLYMGRISNDSNAGRILLMLGDNTENELYNFLIEGFALKNPLPLSTYPNPWI